MEALLSAMSYLSATNILGTVILLLLVAWYFPRSSKLPPGPRGLPIFGYIPFLDPSNPSITFNKVAKKYGPVFSIYLGTEPYIVCNDYENIRKTLMGHPDAFSGRPPSLAATMQTKRKGLVMTDGPTWKDKKNFMVTALRHFGMGKRSLEPFLLSEIQFFMKELEDFGGMPANIRDPLSTSVCNNICILEFGNRFDYKDKDFIYMNHCVDIMLLTSRNTGIMAVFPWLKYVPFVSRLLGIAKAAKAASDLDTLIRKIYKEKLESYYPGRMESYVDAIIAERQTENNVFADFDDEDLFIDLRILFAAGTETTANTLLWSFLYLMAYPDMQRKIQQQIDEVIGHTRLPSNADKPLMPYVEAFLNEIHRMCSLVPMGVLHRTMEDVEVNGFFYPKGITVVQNMWAINHDPKLWPDPMTFRPERFLNEKGELTKPEYLIAFGLGRRACLGEPLSRMELFLFITCILQKFNILNPEGETISFKGTTTITYTPFPYKAQFVLRDL